MAIPVNDKLVTVESLKAGLDIKANATDVYEKTETYTKTEVDDAIQESTAKYGNVTFLRYWNASTLTVDLGFIPTINKGAQAVLFNANQRVLALILFGGSDDSRYVNVSGTITYTISHNDSVYTITASSVLWGNTTLLVDHG